MQPNPIFVPMTVNVESPSIPMELGTAINVEVVDAPVYDGNYDVMPTFEQQNLETRNKLLREDVIVHPIAVSRTQNLAGGTTIFIGG